MGIAQQPTSLMVYSKRQINFVRMSVPSQQKSADSSRIEGFSNVCDSKIIDIDQVVNDVNNINVFVALSKKDNAI